MMVVTVAGTVATSNLAIGVGAGVLTAMAAFARKVAHLVDVDRVLDPDGTAVFYSVTGELFFASDQELIDAFDYAERSRPRDDRLLARARLGRLRRGRAGRDRSRTTRATAAT